MDRENFKSRLGFLLVSAGCAIGIGNVWKFPFVTGENGGGVFVLFYLLFLVIMGAPVLSMELAVGRASRKSAVQGYQALEPKGSKWHIHGWICILGNLLLMMYYTTVSGWMLNYAVRFIGGSFNDVQTDQVGGIFDAMLASPAQTVGYMTATILIGILVCSMGLQNGIEKVTKVMMLGLLSLIVILAVHSMTLSGAAFYSFAGSGLHGDFRKLHVQGSDPGRRVAEDLRSGYLRGHCVRSDHFSGLFFVWSGTLSGTVIDLRDLASGVRPYDRRPDLGKPLFHFYDLCQSFHGDRGI